MLEKENVYEKDLGSDVADGSASSLESRAQDVLESEKGITQSIAAGEDGKKDEEKAILGKFKSVDALTKAYGALEAAFTKKSQELATMKQRVEGLKKADLGVEKLRKNACLRRQREKEFNVFLRELSGRDEEGLAENSVLAAEDLEKQGEKSGRKANAPVGEVFTDKADRYELNEEKSGEILVDMLDDGLKNNRTERLEKPLFSDGVGEKACRSKKDSLENVSCVQEKKGVAKGKDAGFSEEDLYQAVLQNEEVRLKIIGEYLSSIGKKSAPLCTGGVGTLALPPKKAKTVHEAGGMALRYFKDTQAER